MQEHRGRLPDVQAGQTLRLSFDYLCLLSSMAISMNRLREVAHAEAGVLTSGFPVHTPKKKGKRKPQHRVRCLSILPAIFLPHQIAHPHHPRRGQPFPAPTRPAKASPCSSCHHKISHSRIFPQPGKYHNAPGHALRGVAGTQMTSASSAGRQHAHCGNNTWLPRLSLGGNNLSHHAPQRTLRKQSSRIGTNLATECAGVVREILI